MLFIKIYKSIENILILSKIDYEKEIIIFWLRIKIFYNIKKLYYYIYNDKIHIWLKIILFDYLKFAWIYQRKQLNYQMNGKNSHEYV